MKGILHGVRWWWWWWGGRWRRHVLKRIHRMRSSCGEEEGQLSHLLLMSCSSDLGRGRLLCDEGHHPRHQRRQRARPDAPAGLPEQLRRQPAQQGGCAPSCRPACWAGQTVDITRRPACLLLPMGRRAYVAAIAEQ